MKPPRILICASLLVVVSCQRTASFPTPTRTAPRPSTPSLSKFDECKNQGFECGNNQVYVCHKGEVKCLGKGVLNNNDVCGVCPSASAPGRTTGSSPTPEPTTYESFVPTIVDYGIGLSSSEPTLDVSRIEESSEPTLRAIIQESSVPNYVSLSVSPSVASQVPRSATPSTTIRSRTPSVVSQEPRTITPTSGLLLSASPSASAAPTLSRGNGPRFPGLPTEAPANSPTVQTSSLPTTPQSQAVCFGWSSTMLALLLSLVFVQL
jgi:hypothetical protein